MTWEVTLAAVGGHVTQGRAVGRVDGREILTVNAALGKGDLAVGGIWVTPPEVPSPDQCPPRFLPEFFRNTIMDSIEVRQARGRTFEEMDGTPGPPDSAMWAHVPGHLTQSAATLAILGDYVSGAVSQPLGDVPGAQPGQHIADGPGAARPSGCWGHQGCTPLVGGYAQGIASCGAKPASFWRRRASRSACACGLTTWFSPR